ncbi:MAG: primosomal protein N' (replication factor Y) - superfamily II helicase [Pseudomonadota bacterium]
MSEIQSDKHAQHDDLFKITAPSEAPNATDETRFPCTSCGSVLTYAVGTDQLECTHCGTRNAIAIPDVVIEEISLPKGLEKLEHTRSLGKTETILKCPNCAAEFDLDAHLHASDCPFCGTTVVTSTGEIQEFSPQALLPFSITKAQAHEAYEKWIKRLWFAPSKLKKHAREEFGLNGIYIPYWTYDSDTKTAYSGQRGDVYYVRQNVTVMENGRYVRRSKMVPKIRWTPVHGSTDRHFDDVLIGATRTLPRKITDWLEPWDLENLVPYKEDYLSGFQSEVYQVALDEGFGHAEQVMKQIIRNDVRRSIGGDQQRIQRLHTKHSDTTFKHVLLPLWTAAFTFRNKTYRFVVNGRNGRTRGERPYSVIKIVLTGACVAAVVIAGAMTIDTSQLGGYVSDRPIFYPADPLRF